MGDLLGELRGRTFQNELLKQARAVVRLEAKAKRQRAELVKTLDDLRTARRFVRELAVSKADELTPPPRLEELPSGEDLP